MDGGRGLKAAESVRMTLLDHIILADEQYYSFKDNKKLMPENARGTGQ